MSISIGANVPPLPRLDDAAVPAWRLTRHAASVVITMFLMLLGVAAIATSVMTIRITVSANGTLEPGTVTSVRTEEAGRIAAVLVHAGDTVRAGQVIAQLDSEPALSEVQQLRAQIDAARLGLLHTKRSEPIDSLQAAAAVDGAQARVVRARVALLEKMSEFSVHGDVDSVAELAPTRRHVGLDLPSAELLAAKADLRGTEAALYRTTLASIDVERNAADVRRLEAQLAGVKRHLAHRAILATEDGVVLTDQPERLTHAIVHEGDVLVELGSLAAWQTSVAVSEADVSRVAPGDSALVDIAAFAKTEHNRARGRVLSVSKQPESFEQHDKEQNTPQSAGYHIVIVLDAVDLKAFRVDDLRRGYTTRARIITRSGHPFALLKEYVRSRIRGEVFF